MTNSMMKWHLARDNQIKLAKFCEGNKVDIEWDLNNPKYPTAKFVFDNWGFIRAELEQGTSTADYFQVVGYDLGATR